jgi:hypothetical protein
VSISPGSLCGKLSEGQTQVAVSIVSTDTLFAITRKVC